MITEPKIHKRCIEYLERLLDDEEGHETGLESDLKQDSAIGIDSNIKSTRQELVRVRENISELRKCIKYLKNIK